MGVINNNIFGLIKGEKGATPEIGENGNWWIDGVDTGKPSRGATGETGATGANGQDGADGLGVPAGGTTGQVLTKVSDADNDTSWQNLKGGRSVDITQYRQNNKFIFPVNIINECVKEFLNGCSVVFVDKNDEDKPTSYKMISATQDGSGYENIYIFTLETYSKKGEVPVVAKSGYFPTEETYHIDAIADLSGGGLDGASFLGNGMTRICVYDDRTIAEEAQKASYDGQSRKIDETYYVKPEGGIPKTDLSAEVTDEITPLVATDQLTYSENEYNINHAFLPLKTSFNRTPIQDEIFNAVLNVTDVNGDYLYAAQAVVQVYNANYDLDHVECRVVSKYRISGQDGADGQDGAQGRGYYRTEAILSTATASIERSRINPTNGKLLVSDTIVDRNGLVFAVTKECDVGDETVYLAYRTSIKGADGLGVPAGGTAGQILAKKTKTDYDTEWIDAPSGGGSTMYAHHLRISDYGFATGTEQVNIAATIINTSANAITFDTLKAYLETLDNGYSKRLMVSGCAHDGTGVTAIVYGLMLSSNNILAIYNAMTSTQVEQSTQLNNSAMVDDTVVQIC